MAQIRYNTLEAFLDQAKREDLSRIFLICGEPFLVRKAFDQLTGFILKGVSKEFSMDILDGQATPVGEILEQATTFSFFQSVKIIAVKEAPLFTAKTGTNEITYGQKDLDLLANLAEKGLPQGHILVMTTQAPDKRKKIFKTFDTLGTVIDCTVAQGTRKTDQEEQQGVLRDLAREILAGTNKQMDATAFTALVELTGFHPELFAGNIQKLLAYTGARPLITAKDVMAVVHRDKKDPVFSLTNAALDRDGSKALAYLASLFAEGFHPLQILKTLENQIRKLLAIKIFVRQTFEVTPGLPPIKSMHFNGFKQVMMPRIAAHDQALADQLKSWDAVTSPELPGATKKKGPALTSDLLLAPDPKNPYPVYQNFLKSENFSFQELSVAIMMLSDLDHGLKRSAVHEKIGIENFIMTLCQKRRGS